MKNDLSAHFSAYPKVSETAMPVNEVEEWLAAFPHKRAENKPNGGIIQSTPTVMFIDGLGDKLTPSQHREAKRKAQREFKAAKRALAKQDKEDQKAIAKKLREWSKAPEKPRATGKIERRLRDLEVRLNNGEMIPVPKNDGDRKEYQKIRRDIRTIRNTVDGSLVRTKVIAQEDSFWTIDRFATHAGDFDVYCKKAVLLALKTGQAIRLNANLHQEEAKALSSAMQELARRKGVEITSIFGLDNTIKGWVMV